MSTLTLEIVQTSPMCLRFRLLDTKGSWYWQNRVENSERGEAGARSRMQAWAEQHGYQIREGVKVASQRRAG